MRIESVEGAHHGVSAAGPEEVQPSAEIRVERGDAAPEGLSPRSRRQLADSRVDAGFRPLRQEDFDRAVLRLAPEAEADEVPFFGSRYRTLGLIHLEAQPPLDEPDHTGHHTVPRAFASDVDVRVVGVAHEAVAAPGELAVELVQHDITEQRRQRPALRHTLLRAHHHSVGHHHLGFQHPVDEREEPPVCDLRLQPRHQTLMVDAVEEFLEVEIDHPLVPVLQVLLCLGDRRVTAASRSKAMARCVESRLVVRAEHVVHGLLDPPVHDIGLPRSTRKPRGLLG